MRSIATILVSGAVAVGASAAPIEVRFEAPTAGLGQVAQQLQCMVMETGSGSVSFAFTNTAVISSAVAQIYFRDAGILGPSVLHQQGTGFVEAGVGLHGVRYQGQLSAGFAPTRSFAANSGIDPVLGINADSDLLRIEFSLLAGHTFHDVESALRSGEMRLALHATHIGPQGVRETFTNSALVVVPLPPPLLGGLAGVGVILIGYRRRRGC